MNAKKKFQAAEKKVTSMIKTNPERAVLIAAGIGAAIGAGITAAIKLNKKK